jgi:hypothetical protein
MESQEQGAVSSQHSQRLTLAGRRMHSSGLTYTVSRQLTHYHPRFDCISHPMDTHHSHRYSSYTTLYLANRKIVHPINSRTSKEEQKCAVQSYPSNTTRT